MPEGRHQGNAGIIPWGKGLLPFLVVMFVLIRLLETKGTAPVWMSSYGDDLLCLPLVLSLVLMVHRLALANPGFVLPVSHGLAAVIGFGIFFEGFLPRFGSGAVGDPLDLLMYFCGYGVFQLGLNRSALKGIRMFRGPSGRCGSSRSCRHSPHEIFPSAVNQ